MLQQGAGTAAARPTQDGAQVLDRLHAGYRTLKEEIHKAIVGQDEVIDAVLCAMLAGGHCMVQGVPGLAKTLLVKSIADAMRLEFNRIQFTPDLMPSDITGTEIIQDNPESGHRQYEFMRGPIFAHVILADEINRTPPKTQAALLQAMQEREVTISGRTYPLHSPFFILATQNPIEQEGTYPLPEAALDRFMFMVFIDYPSGAEEFGIVKRTTTVEVPRLNQVWEQRDMLQFQHLVRTAPVSDPVIEYAVRITRSTRPKDPSATEMVKKYLKYGAGPRSGQFLTLGSKALALMHGRVTPSFDDVRRISKMVLRHRLITNFDAEADGIDVEQIITDLVERVHAPK